MFWEKVAFFLLLFFRGGTLSFSVLAVAAALYSQVHPGEVMFFIIPLFSNGGLLLLKKNSTLEDNIGEINPSILYLFYFISWGGI